MGQDDVISNGIIRSLLNYNLFFEREQMGQSDGYDAFSVAVHVEMKRDL